MVAATPHPSKVETRNLREHHPSYAPSFKLSMGKCASPTTHLHNSPSATRIWWCTLSKHDAISRPVVEYCVPWHNPRYYATLTIGGVPFEIRYPINCGNPFRTTSVPIPDARRSTPRSVAERGRITKDMGDHKPSEIGAAARQQDATRSAFNLKRIQ